MRSRSIGLLPLVIAACVRTESFELNLHSDARSALYVLVENCLDGSEDPDQAGCTSTAEVNNAFVEEAETLVALSMAQQDRLFVAQYGPAIDDLGLPSMVDVTETADCSRRPFPPVLDAVRFDTGEGTADIEALPSDRTLPMFEYGVCFSAGRCLGTNDDVPICSDECGSRQPPVGPAIFDPSSDPDIRALATSRVVPDCTADWFDFGARACGPRPDSCAGATGWPLVDPPGARYFDPEIGAGGDGSKLAPHQRLSDLTLERPPVLVMRASGTPHQLDLPLDWNVEIIGCNAAGISSVLPGLRIEGGTVRVRDLTINVAPVIVDPGATLVLSDSAVERGRIEVQQGAAAELSSVLVRATSTTAIQVAGRLIGEDVYVTNTISHALDCRATGTVDLRGLWARDVKEASGAVARAGCRFAMRESSLSEIDLHGIQIDTALTSTLASVYVERHGRTSGSYGIRAAGANLWARSIRIAGPATPSVEREGRAGIVVEDGNLDLEVAVLEGGPSAIRTRDATVALRRVTVDNTTQEGLRFWNGSVVTLAGVEVVEAGTGIELESAEVRGERVSIQVFMNDAMTLDRSALCSESCGSHVDLTDVSISTGNTGVKLEADAAQDGSTLVLDRATVRDVVIGFDVTGGSVEITNGVVESSVGAIWSRNEGPTRLSLASSAVDTGIGLKVSGTTREALDRLTVERLDVMMLVDTAIELEVCGPDLVHRFLAEARVTAPAETVLVWKNEPLSGQ